MHNTNKKPQVVGNELRRSPEGGACEALRFLLRKTAGQK